MWLYCIALWFFQQPEPIAITSAKKVTFGWISWLNKAKIIQKIAEN